MTPETLTTLASARGSGSGGPSAHRSKLPTGTVSGTYTSACAVVPVGAADVQELGPDLGDAAVGPRRRQRELVGRGCHGTTAPTGAGQGSVSFSGEQRLIGDQARTPRSTVRLTVR